MIDEEHRQARARQPRADDRDGCSTIFRGRGVAGDTTGNSPGSKWVAFNAIAEHLDYGRRYTHADQPGTALVRGHRAQAAGARARDRRLRRIWSPSRRGHWASSGGCGPDRAHRCAFSFASRVDPARSIGTGMRLGWHIAGRTTAQRNQVAASGLERAWHLIAGDLLQATGTVVRRAQPRRHNSDKPDDSARCPGYPGSRRTKTVVSSVLHAHESQQNESRHPGVCLRQPLGQPPGGI